MLGLISVLLFLHPYVTYPLSLRLFRSVPIRFGDRNDLPTATLVFSAFNEEASMPEKIANLRAIREVVPNIQFKAYVDLSTDRTLELLQANSDLIDVHAAPERTGKALGMRRLVAHSDTEVMIFTDANVILDPATVPNLLRYFSDPAVGGVCGTLVYVNPGESATAEVNSLYWRLEEYIKKNEARSGSTMGADGSIFATRRAYYPEVPAHLLDDFIVSMSIVFAGLRLVSAPDVLAYEKLAEKSSDEFRRKRRIACRAYSSHRHLKPQLLRMAPINGYKYVSHRLIRWYGAALAALSGLFLVLATLQLAGPIWATALAILGVGAAGLLIYGGFGPLSKMSEMGRAIWATMLGVMDAWRGKRYQTWQPVQTR
ncbi:glycosyltransferase [Sphingomonas immobilis]|uniref:Glycosyltransferase n=1 Tax=Sphingomonas immobilis TaxID=3063997 RepID=A0ABT9A6I6_9SPHN|nr:glycosyltransferase [Sphingomonas sp. CA1-15]MDO7844596.1 glycosyltransferase [Sphingomonas sp. CA1-15]